MHEKWEYTMLTGRITDVDFAEILTSQGEDGWEAVGITTLSDNTMVVLFKRRKAA